MVMQNPLLLPTAKPELRLGSRPTAAGTLRFSLDGTPHHERPTRFREFFAGIGVRCDAAPEDSDPVEIDMTLQALPGLQLLAGRIQGVRYRRSSQSADPTEDVGVIINHHGQYQITQQGKEVVLGEGDATLVSLTEPMMHRPTGDFLALRVPLPRLGPYLADRQAGVLRRIPRSIPALRLLTNYVHIAWQEQTLADPGLQRPLASHLCDLMALAIGATRDAAEIARDRGLRAARLYAIKQDIAGHLDQADLSVHALAARHRLTPRFIQRLFETEGTTFTEYVLTQRLAAARICLIDPCFDREKISSVAYDCGFGDVSYFNRAFRRVYGAAPSEVRAQARLAVRDRG